ncbi:MAG: MlaD family protein [Candidatus Binatia bacterium]
MGKKANPAIIGAFVLGAIGLAISGVLVFGSGQFFRRTTEYVMYFPGSVNGLSVGASVKFKGVDVGTVTNIQLVLAPEEKHNELSIPVFVQIDPSKITVDGAPLDTARPEVVEEMIKRGLRGQLQSQSLVTGILFVQIDFFKDTPAKFVLPQPSDPPEIPTVQTTLEQAQSAAREIIDELRSIKFGPMVEQASEALTSINTLVSSPALQTTIDALPGTVQSLNRAIASLQSFAETANGRVGPLATRLDDTLASAESALTSVRDTVGTAQTLIAPGSPLDHDLRATLRDVATAAQAMAQLADFLERNPSSLLYGKQPPKQETP